ncbi:MAG: hypothetical protein ABSH29_08915 [Acidimicrobiales bacterium]
MTALLLEASLTDPMGHMFPSPRSGFLDRSYGAYVSFAEVWNGLQWTQYDFFYPGYQLNSVSCATASKCLAVGSIVESWNGSFWNQIGTGEFNGVSCVAVNDCDVTGEDAQGADIESWDGSSFTDAPVAEVPGSDLFSVSCVGSLDNCTAAGTSDEEVQTLVETDTGGAWGTVSSANEGTGEAQLQGISCTDAGLCEAVGYYLDEPSGDTQTLAENNLAGPPAETPEVPYAVALPFFGLAAWGVSTTIVRRRKRQPDSR